MHDVIMTFAIFIGIGCLLSQFPSLEAKPWTPAPPKPPKPRRPLSERIAWGLLWFFGGLMLLGALFPDRPKASGSQLDFSLMDTEPGPWKHYVPGTCAAGKCVELPAAIPAPTPHDRPLYYPWLPEKPAPQPEPSRVEPIGWGVDDLSGPWPASEIRPASARTERMLRRFHEAQGVEMGG